MFTQVVIMRDVPFHEMDAILQFIYRGEIHVHELALPHLLRTARLLEIRGLSDHAPPPTPPPPPPPPQAQPPPPPQPTPLSKPPTPQPPPFSTPPPHSPSSGHAHSVSPIHRSKVGLPNQYWLRVANDVT